MHEKEIVHAFYFQLGYKNIPKIVITYEGDTDFTPRVESFPVIGHTPVERGVCWEFRNSSDVQKAAEESMNQFYRIGYLEK